MAQLCISLLGPFHVTLDGEPVTAFESDKVRALLAYLAVEAGHPHRREKLAGLLWPEFPERSARANLSRALLNLRIAIGDRARSGDRAGIGNPAGIPEPGGIRDHLATPPLLLITHQTIQFNRASDAWVDVLQFSDLSGLQDLTGLEQATALYRGDFLEGFSLPGCPAFEEWALFEAERLRRLALQALDLLAHRYEAQRDLERALAADWRQLELDPWRESAHRQVMRLLALTGQRPAALAQYEALREMLREELGVEPAPETAVLYEQIRDGTLPPELARRPAPPPAFLIGQAPPTRPPVFVAREPELARLEGYLSAALNGRGQMAFVVGGPGRGKTALLGEFARRAMDTHPELLLAMGAGGAYAGVGDPYLPFREVVAMLSGEVEGRWAAGTVTTDQARRIWAALPEVGAILAERGSDLVGTLLPARELLGRARAAAPGGAGWLERLERLAGRDTPTQGLEQSHLFEQVANVLLDLSARHPLLLVLDDLQWADLASISLLFHLGRRVERGRILLAGAYRPHELALGRDGQRHPLEPVLAELRARFGDVWLDLAVADEAGGRRFVDRFLDTEPNRLAEGFRTALFQRTGGHPLFTIELLRAMQGRGDLVRDEAGRWSEGERLAWDALPARVEAAIAERIDRLPEPLRRVLAVASVEGEEFTAQAVARVQGLDELQILRLLSGELAGRQRLVREQGEVRVDGSTLSRYRFAHSLFQQHLYQGLGEGERRLLHRRVGEVLEGLYEGRLEEAAVQLARHFAGDPERERRYTRLAGERAAAQYANEEAVRFLSRALDLTPDSEVADRYAVLLAREKLHERMGSREGRQQDLAQMEGLLQGLGVEQQAEVAHRRAVYLSDRGDLASGVAAGRAAVELAREAGCADVELTAHQYLAWALGVQGDLAGAALEWEAAAALARESRRLDLQASGQASLANLHWEQGDYSRARMHYEQALSLYRTQGDRSGEAYALGNHGVCCIEQGDYGAALASLHLFLATAREIGHRSRESAAMENLSLLHHILGRYEQARGYAEWALHQLIVPPAPFKRAYKHWLLGNVARCLADYSGARSYGDEALRLYHQVPCVWGQIVALQALGHLYEELGELEAARACYAQGLRLCRESSQLPTWATGPLAGLASVALAEADLASAQMHAAEILSVLDPGAILPCEIRRFWIYLTCYQALRATGHPCASEVLSTAHERLLQEAATIPDEALRRSFLENVVENREIVRAWEAAQAGVSPGDAWA